VKFGIVLLYSRFERSGGSQQLQDLVGESAKDIERKDEVGQARMEVGRKIVRDAPLLVASGRGNDV
jgi:hypothetical protein